MLSSISFPSILVAAVAAFLLGFLWHGPIFGKAWIRLSGISQAEIDAEKAKGMGGMCPRMVVAFVQQIVVAFALAYLLSNLPVVDITGAVFLAGLVWFGFVATTLLNQVLWEKKTIQLYLFNITYHLASLIVITVIIAAMGGAGY